MTTKKKPDPEELVGEVVSPAGAPETALEPAEPQNLGPTNDLNDILEFLEAALVHPKCARDFGVAHVGEGDTTSVLETRQLDRKAAGDDAMKALHEIARFFENAAKKDVKVHTLPQTYMLLAWSKDSQPYATMKFRKYPPLSNAIGNVSETSSQAGQDHQAMRLAEVYASQNYKTTGMMVDFARDTRKEDKADWMQQRVELRARIKDLETKNDAMMALREGMLSQQLERDILKKRAEAQIANEEKLWKAAMAVGQIWLTKQGIDLPGGLAGMLAGGTTSESAKAAAGSDVTANDLMQALLESLTPEQKKTFVGALNEDQVGKLLALGPKLAAEQAARKAAAVAAAAAAAGAKAA